MDYINRYGPEGKGTFSRLIWGDADTGGGLLFRGLRSKALMNSGVIPFFRHFLGSFTVHLGIFVSIGCIGVENEEQFGSPVDIPFSTQIV
jgi:hypothetical protein